MLNSLNNYHFQCRHERIIKSSIDLIAKLEYSMLKESPISRFGMLRAQAHWFRSNPIFRVMQLILHEPTMAIGYSLRMCALHVNSTNPSRSNLVFRSKPIAEAEMSNRPIAGRRTRVEPANGFRREQSDSLDVLTLCTRFSILQGLLT